MQVSPQDSPNEDKTYDKKRVPNEDAEVMDGGIGPERSLFSNRRLSTDKEER